MANWLKDFNDNYATAISAITPFIIGIISWLYYKVYTESKRQEGDAASIVKPIFWSIGKKYKILAVHNYEKSEDVSGYTHIAQNSRPDQWQKLISIKNSFLNLRFEVKPINSNDILSVIISRNGKEKWRVIEFNK